MRKLLFMAAVAVLLSCNGGREGMIVVDCRSKTLCFDDMFAGFDVVALSSDSIPVGDVSDFCFCGDMVYVLDGTASAVFMFNKRSGEMLRRVYGMGGGPDEYVDPVAVDCGNDRVLLLDRYSGIIAYDRELNVAGRVKLKEMPLDFVTVNGGFVVRNELVSSHKFSFVDMKGEIKSNYIPVNKYNGYGKTNLGGYRELAVYGDTAYVCDGARTEIYGVFNGRIIRVFNFNFGRNTMPRNVNRNDFPDGFPYVDKMGFFVTERFIILDFFLPGDSRRYYAFYDVRTGSVTAGYFPPMDSVIPFFPLKQDGDVMVGANRYSVLEGHGAFAEFLSMKYPGRVFDADDVFLIYYRWLNGYSSSEKFSTSTSR
jgi:hypothetical protein